VILYVAGKVAGANFTKFIGVVFLLPVWAHKVSHDHLVCNHGVNHSWNAVLYGIWEWHCSCNTQLKQIYCIHVWFLKLAEVLYVKLAVSIWKLSWPSCPCTILWIVFRRRINAQSIWHDLKNNTMNIGCTLLLTLRGCL